MNNNWFIHGGGGGSNRYPFCFEPNELSDIKLVCLYFMQMNSCKQDSNPIWLRVRPHSDMAIWIAILINAIHDGKRVIWHFSGYLCRVAAKRKKKKVTQSALHSLNSERCLYFIECNSKWCNDHCHLSITRKRSWFWTQRAILLTIGRTCTITWLKLLVKSIRITILQMG